MTGNQGSDFAGVYLQHVVIPQRYGTSRRPAPAPPYRPGETLARCANADLPTTDSLGPGALPTCTMSMPPRQACPPWLCASEATFSEMLGDEVASQASTLPSASGRSSEPGSRRRKGSAGSAFTATSADVAQVSTRTSTNSEPSASDAGGEDREEERPVGSISSCTASTADEEPLPSSNSTTADTEESAAALSLGSRLLAEVMSKRIGGEKGGVEGMPEGISAALTSWAEQISAGSKDHLRGTCKPCAFAAKGSCENGASCSFCHICGPGEKKRRMKARSRRWKGGAWDMPWQVDAGCGPQTGDPQFE